MTQLAIRFPADGTKSGVVPRKTLYLMFGVSGQFEVAAVQLSVTPQVLALLLVALVMPENVGLRVQFPVAVALTQPLVESAWHLPAASVAATTRYAYVYPAWTAVSVKLPAVPAAKLNGW